MTIENKLYEIESYNEELSQKKAINKINYILLTLMLYVISYFVGVYVVIIYESQISFFNFFMIHVVFNVFLSSIVYFVYKSKKAKEIKKIKKIIGKILKNISYIEKKQGLIRILEEESKHNNLFSNNIKYLEIIENIRIKLKKGTFIEVPDLNKIELKNYKVYHNFEKCYKMKEYEVYECFVSKFANKFYKEEKTKEENNEIDLNNNMDIEYIEEKNRILKGLLNRNRPLHFGILSIISFCLIYLNLYVISFIPLLLLYLYNFNVTKKIIKITQEINNKIKYLENNENGISKKILKNNEKIRKLRIDIYKEIYKFNLSLEKVDFYKFKYNSAFFKCKDMRLYEKYKEYIKYFKVINLLSTLKMKNDRPFKNEKKHLVKLKKFSLTGEIVEKIVKIFGKEKKKSSFFKIKNI